MVMMTVNLIKICESFKEDNRLHLVLELGNGGNVFDSGSSPIV